MDLAFPMDRRQWEEGQVEGLTTTPDSGHTTGEGKGSGGELGCSFGLKSSLVPTGQMGMVRQRPLKTPHLVVQARVGSTSFWTEELHEKVFAPFFFSSSRCRLPDQCLNYTIAAGWRTRIPRRKLQEHSYSPTRERAEAMYKYGRRCRAAALEVFALGLRLRSGCGSEPVTVSMMEVCLSCSGEGRY